MKTQNQIERACPGTSHWPALIRLALVATTALTFAACDSEPGGGGPNPPLGPDCKEDGTCPNVDDKKSSGEECTTSAECESGLCTTLTSTSNIAFCFERCSSQADCADTEEDTTCTSITNRQGQFTQACVSSDFCHDLDGDGYGEGPGCIAFDCDDNNANVYPGADEYCDGVDNNCNGVVDESPVDTNTLCETGYPGECAAGRWSCILGQRLCTALVLPNQNREVCDGRDNDCDGKTDEGPDGFDQNFIAGLGQACGAAGDACFSGITVCDPETRIISCDGEREITDVPDVCDYIDNNCDGQIDEDVRDAYPNFGTPCTVGLGTCRANGIVACVPNDPLAAPVCNAVANSGNSSPEICDYNDNDCDGVADNGFINAQGIYNTPAHCGSCGNDCSLRWDPNPAAFGVVSTCSVGGGTATCAFTCMAGRVDIDGVPHNGCEFTPDTGAVYVALATNSARPGTDNATCGNWDAPCATIAHALTRTNTSSRPRVRVSEGIFAGGFDLVNGISILGGHSARNWTRDTLTGGGWANNTTLQGGKASGVDAYAIKATDITLPTTISGLTIEAPDAAGTAGNSIGIWIVNSNQNLQITGNTILGGRGGSGTSGAAGTNGTSGAAGANGTDRLLDETSCSNNISSSTAGAAGNVRLLGGAGGINTCGSTNVSGGYGAPTTCPNNSATTINNRTNGQAFNGNGTAGGSGGNSTLHWTRSTISYGIHGCGNNTGPDPAPGGPGANGSSGSAGAGASNTNGSINSGMWRGASGATGGDGAHASGGGGGGSSGGARNDNNDNNSNPREAYHIGATGGGGGAGGCAGTGATGGSAGGASMGIFVTFASTPSAATRPVISGNTITRGLGGTGGTGGLGGVGGDGGAGGNGGMQQVAQSPSKGWSRCGLNAAPGGPGGRGGHGGGGGGGAGGISYDIVVGGSTNSSLDAYQGANTYTQANGIATGGAGGAGGGAIQSPGTAGAQGSSGNFRRF